MDLNDSTQSILLEDCQDVDGDLRDFTQEDINDAALKNKENGYIILTLNMGGSNKSTGRETVKFRKTLVKIVIQNCTPDIIFIQECNSKSTLNEVLNSNNYDYQAKLTYSSAYNCVCWKKKKFYREEDIDRKVNGVLERYNIDKGRVCVAKLNVEDSEFRYDSTIAPLVCCSWHGPNKINERDKKETLSRLQQAMIRLALPIREERRDHIQPNEVCVENMTLPCLIGGDFNIDTETYSTKILPGFTFSSHNRTDRSENRVTKDNFLYSHCSHARKHHSYPFYVNVEETKPLDIFDHDLDHKTQDLDHKTQKFIVCNLKNTLNERIEVSKAQRTRNWQKMGTDKDIMDHDPIIGVLSWTFEIKKI